MSSRKKTKRRSTERTVSAALPVPVDAPLKRDRTLWLALGISVALHGVLLSLHFTFPDASRTLQEKALDIILVNARSARKPTDAQALAQANLDGGGNSDQKRRAKTPLPPAERVQTGSDLEDAQQRVQALEAQQRRLLEQARSQKALPMGEEQGAQAPVLAPLNGRDLASRSLELARLQAEIARNTEEYNSRPRVKNLGTRAEEYRFAQYMEDWRNKVERVGTLNYPEAARGKLSGSLRITVWIKNDGSVAKVELDRPSGHRVLDDAARRIVRLAEPYAEFPPDIRRDYDQISITRTWTFTTGNRIETD